MVETRSIFGWLIALSTILYPLVSPHAEMVTSCGRSLDPSGEWPVQSPEDAGLDPVILCALDGDLDRTVVLGIHGVVVVRGGKLVYETYRPGDDRMLRVRLGAVPHDAATLHDVRSVTKSVVSLLIGIALDRGLIAGVDQPALAYLPDYAALRTDDNQRILLRHLLTMTSGLRWNEDLPYDDPKNSLRLMNEAADPYRHVLEQKLVHEPGKWWEYNSGNTMLLGAVLRHATDKELPDFAREALLEPLGITRVEWIDVPPAHQPAAWGGLRLLPRDMARIGQLVLNGGTWQGRRIVSADWIAESTQPRLKGWSPFDYGYQWVVGQSTVTGRNIPWIAAWGYGGQRLYIVPSLDLAVAITAGLWDTGTQDTVVLGVLEDYVLASVQP